MKIFLTFDIEVWCNDWNALDDRFPAAFERYVYGRSSAGDWALPKTLETLDRHGIHGVFFVEPLFAARFGVEHLGRIVSMIQDAGQEVQMHLHPEWTDEIQPPVFPLHPEKRQHLFMYSLDEQIELMKRGRALLHQAGAQELNAFRAGSFAADRNTLKAASHCGFAIDSSLNATCTYSGKEVSHRGGFLSPFACEGLLELPISVFRDGFGRLRHAQVGACSVGELSSAIEHAAQNGHQAFTILSHNFEMLRPGSSRRDPIVAARFDRICRFLSEHAQTYPTAGLSSANTMIAWSDSPLPDLPSVGFFPTIGRLAAQAARRSLS